MERKLTGDENIDELSVHQYLALKIFVSRLDAEERLNGSLYGLDLKRLASDASLLAKEAIQGFH
ncbi:hypothetical protein [Pedobacter miscanthi]|uniref:Uncharacterized protein n=1 Tax=Pedobacter miscanthi TaxID=2259170 RepID=A0A366KM97_9SPHI|nr:hypothetical protein [Pedobacter miscanthi]RBQ02817.1 hypothetical protein DRW42_24515 [Pedobacter miscanthi]